MMAEQVHTAHTDEEHASPDQAPHEALMSLATQLRQKQVEDHQTHRQVTFTEDEVKAMADMVEGLAQRMAAPQSSTPSRSHAASQSQTTTPGGDKK